MPRRRRRTPSYTSGRRPGEVQNTTTRQPARAAAPRGSTRRSHTFVMAGIECHAINQTAHGWRHSCRPGFVSDAFADFLPRGERHPRSTDANRSAFSTTTVGISLEQFVDLAVDDVGRSSWMLWLVLSTVMSCADEVSDTQWAWPAVHTSLRRASSLAAEPAYSGDRRWRRSSDVRSTGRWWRLPRMRWEHRGVRRCSPASIAACTSLGRRGRRRTRRLARRRSRCSTSAGWCRRGATREFVWEHRGEGDRLRACKRVADDDVRPGLAYRLRRRMKICGLCREDLAGPAVRRSHRRRSGRRRVRGRSRQRTVRSSPSPRCFRRNRRSASPLSGRRRHNAGEVGRRAPERVRRRRWWVVRPSSTGRWWLSALRWLAWCDGRRGGGR